MNVYTKIASLFLPKRQPQLLHVSLHSLGSTVVIKKVASSGLGVFALIPQSYATTILFIQSCIMLLPVVNEMILLI